jgi:hypothetical protein
MWKTYNSMENAESDLKKEGFRKVGQYWERGEKYVSLCRVELGQCANGKYVTMHVEHNL